MIIQVCMNYTRWKNNVPNGINLTEPKWHLEALKEYDNTKSDEIYEALSWVVFTLIIFSPNEQTNILQTYYS